MPESDTTETETRADSSGCSQSPCSEAERIMHAERLWKANKNILQVQVEDEWQTAEDHIELGDLRNAEYFLDRMILEAMRLKFHLKRKNLLSPNAGHESRSERSERS